MATKYQVTKEKGKTEMQKVVAVSLTSDMWTSINMDAYLAVTCHYIDDHDKLGTVLLGVEKFSNSHTAANIAQVKTTLMEEWGITDKQATVELSEEKRVSGSKVIPLMNMLQRAVDSEGTNMTTVMAGKLAENLVRRLRDILSNLESLSVMTMATMLDPRFKTHGFFSQSTANEAFTTVVTPSPSDAPSPPPQPAQAAGPATTSSTNLWLPLDCIVDQTRSSNATADPTTEVQRYLREANLD
ncbi:hypothetical protein SKAU_G00274900 [Synaphobranchus kaupii]|uniref:Uncharacterized protein n=1 Tax=Synaphobranchus kaupii TaxID=118154 RepID=A0A9Q1IQY8_SYNKA|nr:hypothetical protein SKAU_G00274900 [Synaphobranchus kaupii]